MKQVAQNYRSGELAVLDVPPPSCAAGGVLVRTAYSLISTGTEMMKVNESRLSLLGKARARPDQVRKVLDTVAQQGPVTAYRKAVNRLDSWTPLGYSLAGVVLDVGAGAEEFRPGQLVACAGNEFAFHADVNWVPTNLCVPVPEGVDAQAAAFATVGAIAMQGVRQASVQLGETAVVIGLGLVGQLVVQLLAASGVKVFGIDVVEERCRLAEKTGATLCAGPDEAGIAAVRRAIAASGIPGADKVFLVAGGPSNGPVETAAGLARDRATVVDIGKCRLDLPWSPYYEKELDLRFSRSYGPGRYDDAYEIGGHDYPVGYVRWTERRNLACFLDLVAGGSVDPSSLLSGVFPVGDAPAVYGKLASHELSGVGFLFEYPEATPEDGPLPVARRAATVPLAGSTPAATLDGVVRIGFIGAGNYASSMLLPHLVGRPDVDLVHVATRRSLSSVNAQRKFGFTSSGTEPQSLLEDGSVDAVFVVTQHSSHADFVCRALRAGKAVFVEKPLALTGAEVDRILDTVAETGNDRLMVGFNRRFSPMFNEIRALYGPVTGPTVARYLVSAGPLGAGSWYADDRHEGSRFAGEGGHFIDTLSWWIGSRPVTVHAVEVGGSGDLEVAIGFEDGSIGSVTYLSRGHVRFPKETFDAAADGRSARLDNFRRASVWKGMRTRTIRAFGAPDKGQRAELDAFLTAVVHGRPMPVGLDALVGTALATLAVPASLSQGTTVEL